MIQNRELKNDENILYVESDSIISVEELNKQIKNHFPGVWLGNLRIRSEKIHMRCLTYDLYDPSDWDDYIIVERMKS